eukprot:scaffold23209_cov79-Isochrysis_galbana.AAC.1
MLATEAALPPTWDSGLWGSAAAPPPGIASPLFRLLTEQCEPRVRRASGEDKRRSQLREENARRDCVGGDGVTACTTRALTQERRSKGATRDSEERLLLEPSQIAPSPCAKPRRAPAASASMAGGVPLSLPHDSRHPSPPPLPQR